MLKNLSENPSSFRAKLVRIDQVASILPRGIPLDEFLTQIEQQSGGDPVKAQGFIDGMIIKAPFANSNGPGPEAAR
ncbi:MAG: hypothetical protein ACOY0S_02065 [Patescibacteria group bacterium]